MKIKEKLLILVIGLLFILFIISPIKSSAGLQANGKSQKADTIANWLLNIRKMEEIGGTLGLTDTINTENLTSASETSNNLDIHMQKNTEYGAMAILSASAYGNQNKIGIGETTTGNRTGILINGNVELVAAEGGDSLYAYQDINTKYENLYKIGSDLKLIGDACNESLGWHGGTGSWFKQGLDDGAPVGGPLYRGNGVIFNFAIAQVGNGFSHRPCYSCAYATRAVVVIGNGF